MKSGEHSAQDLEALSVLQHGISDLNDINPSLLLAFFTQALTQIKSNEGLMKQLEDHGGSSVSEVIDALGTSSVLVEESDAASSSSTVDSGSSGSTAVGSNSSPSKEEPAAEVRSSPASPVAEALYARWIEHLRSKWPIVA